MDLWRLSALENNRIITQLWEDGERVENILQIGNLAQMLIYSCSLKCYNKILKILLLTFFNGHIS